MIPLSSRYHRMRIKTVKNLNNSCFSFALQADKWDIENKNKKKQRSTFPEIVKKIVKYCIFDRERKKFPYSCLSNLWHFQPISIFSKNIDSVRVSANHERIASFRLTIRVKVAKVLFHPVKKTGCLSTSIVISRFMPALHARWIPVHYCLSQRLLGIATVYATFVQI